MLLESGASANAANLAGAAPLHAAAAKCCTELVHLFITAEADINMLSEDGSSPLYFAVHRNVVRQLLCLGCPGSASAAVIARGAGHVAVTELLESEVDGGKEIE